MVKSKGKERPHPSVAKPEAKAAGKSTSREVASKAAEILRREDTPSEVKAVAASALAQVEHDEAAESEDDLRIRFVDLTEVALEEPTSRIAELEAENAALAAEITTLKAELEAQRQWAASLGRKR